MTIAGQTPSQPVWWKTILSTPWVRKAIALVAIALVLGVWLRSRGFTVAAFYPLLAVLVAIGDAIKQRVEDSEKPSLVAKVIDTVSKRAIVIFAMIALLVIVITAFLPRGGQLLIRIPVTAHPFISRSRLVINRSDGLHVYRDMGTAGALVIGWDDLDDATLDTWEKTWRSDLKAAQFPDPAIEPAIQAWRHPPRIGVTDVGGEQFTISLFTARGDCVASGKATIAARPTDLLLAPVTKGGPC